MPKTSLANIKVNDLKYQEIVDLLSRYYRYDPFILTPEGTAPNPETEQAFVERSIKDTIRDIIRQQRINEITVDFDEVD